MNKRLSSIFVIGLTTTLLFTSSGFAASTGISVVADGKKITFSAAKPFKDTNGRLQVPLRSIGEALGAEVTWTESTQTATFKISDTVSSFTVGQKLYKVNGTSVTMDTSVVKKNNSLYAPARFVAESLGASIRWDNATGVLTVTSASSTGKEVIGTGTKEPTTNNPSNEPKVATVEGFKIPYTELGPNREPVYISNSRLTVFASSKPSAGDYLFQVTISFEDRGADPIQAANEAEAILKQKIEDDVVNTIMKYVRSKSERVDILPYKEFSDKNYEVTVQSKEWGEVDIVIWNK